MRGKLNIFAIAALLAAENNHGFYIWGIYYISEFIFIINIRVTHSNPCLIAYAIFLHEIYHAAEPFRIFTARVDRILGL